MKIRAKNLNFVKHKMQLFLLMGIISKDIWRYIDLTVKAVLHKRYMQPNFEGSDASIGGTSTRALGER